MTGPEVQWGVTGACCLLAVQSGAFGASPDTAVGRAGPGSQISWAHVALLQLCARLTLRRGMPPTPHHTRSCLQCRYLAQGYLCPYIWPPCLCCAPPMTTRCEQQHGLVHVPLRGLGPEFPLSLSPFLVGAAWPTVASSSSPFKLLHFPSPPRRSPVHLLALASRGSPPTPGTSQSPPPGVANDATW